MAKYNESNIIPPMELSGEIKKVRLSEIKSSVLPDKCVDILSAIVGYFDILGFSYKKDWKDIETSLLDFFGPLLIVANSFPNVYINVFSDCAFISTSCNNTEKFLQSIRFAFVHWISDGMLVRGGISVGNYKEIKTIFSSNIPKNFQGNLFSGEGISNAVRNEAKGEGAFVFTDEKTARFLKKTFSEPIFSINNHKFIGWGNDNRSMFWFAGISLIRMILAIRNKKHKSVVEKFKNNILYALNVSKDLTVRFIISAICSSDIMENDDEIHKVLNKIGVPDERKKFSEITKKWLSKDKTFLLLKELAFSDSSLI